VRKGLTTLPLAKPRLKAEAILKTYVLFICGGVHYIKGKAIPLLAWKVP
jgi:hypothetical protein